MSRKGLITVKWSDEEAQLLKDSYQKNKKELLELFPTRSYDAIKQMANKLGLFKEHNEYVKSDTSVLLEETPLAYYWIGFILADGHVSDIGRLRVTLAIKDKNHLLKLANYIKCENIMEYEHDSSYGHGEAISLSTQDNIYLKQLREKFDIKSNKTYNPPQIVFNNDLYLALLVGLIDGDGSVQSQTYRTHPMINFHVHSSWYDFYNNLRKFISVKLNINVNEPKIGKDGYLRWNITNTETVICLKKYAQDNDLPILSRKWDKIDTSFVSRYITTKKRREELFEYIQSNPDVNIKELCDLYNEKDGVIYQDIRLLRKSGLLDNIDMTIGKHKRLNNV